MKLRIGPTVTRLLGATEIIVESLGVLSCSFRPHRGQKAKFPPAATYILSSKRI